MFFLLLTFAVVFSVDICCSSSIDICCKFAVCFCVCYCRSTVVVHCLVVLLLIFSLYTLLLSLGVVLLMLKFAFYFVNNTTKFFYQLEMLNHLTTCFLTWRYVLFVVLFVVGILLWLLFCCLCMSTVVCYCVVILLLF